MLTTIVVPHRSNHSALAVSVEQQDGDVFIKVERSSYIVQSNKYSVHQGRQVTVRSL